MQVKLFYDVEVMNAWLKKNDGFFDIDIEDIKFAIAPDGSQQYLVMYEGEEKK